MTSSYKSTAEEAYESHAIAVQALMEELQELIEDMPAPGGETHIHWGHVGNMQYIRGNLKDLIRSVASLK